ncbi:MAG: hypothetical protein AAF938_12545 [Myxococcota bacterium]
MSWRPADEGLLQHLQCAAAAAAYCEHLGANAPAAQALIADQLERDPEAVQRARLGDFLLVEHRLQRAEPQVLARILDALARAVRDPVLYARALASWASGEEALRSVAKGLAPELDAADRHVAVEDAAFESLDALTAGDDADRLLLLRVDALSKGHELIPRLRRMARRATETLLQPAEQALGALAGEAVGPRHVAAIAELAAAIQRVHAARALETAEFVAFIDGPLLSRAIDLAWPLYHAKADGPLSELLAHLRPAMARVGQIVAAGELAYASRVAQLHVFDAETQNTLDLQLAAIERALKLCPTHRNGRLVGAGLYAHRGLLWLRGGSAAKARVEAERARVLWPEHPRLAKLDGQLEGR